MRRLISGRLSSSFEELLVNEIISPVQYFLGLKGIKAWSGCANEYLRSHFSREILSSSCEELGDFLLQPYRGMALLISKFPEAAIIRYSRSSLAYAPPFLQISSSRPQLTTIVSGVFVGHLDKRPRQRRRRRSVVHQRRVRGYHRRQPDMQWPSQEKHGRGKDGHRG